MPELLVSFCVVLLATPLVLRGLRQRGMLDIPNARSSHITPVPRGGGFGCALGMLAGLVVASVLDRDVPWVAASAALGLAAVGAVDDQRGLGAGSRLTAQLAIGAAVGAAVGGGWWWLAAGAFCVAVTVNVVNFMDGINGITGLNVGAWGLVAMTVGIAQHESSLMVVGALTAGLAAGFLPWNAPRARIFLGDVGSYLLGGLVGAGVVMAAVSTPSVAVVVAPLTIYLADTFSVLIRRAARGEALTTAHRQHVYQRLVDESGMSHVGSALTTVTLALVVTAAWVPGSLLLGLTTTGVVVTSYLNLPGILRVTRPQRRAGHRPSVVVSTTISRTVDGFYGQVMDEFRSRGYEVHVVTSDGPEVSRLRERADAVHLIGMHRAISPVADLWALLAWVRVLRHIRPHAVLGGTPKAALLSMVAARLTGVPRRAYFLQGLRLEGTHGPSRRVLAAMEWLTSRNSHVVIAVSASLAARYLELRLAAGTRVTVPHHGSSHGVDTDYFRPLPRSAALVTRLQMDPDKPLLIFIGRLTADKGLESLIGALNVLWRDGLAVQLLAIGAQDEKDSSHFRQRLESGPTPVRLFDHLPDVRPYLAAADLLVLPTLREGMPNVVLEAAAMGIPAVTTTATGAVDSLVDGQTGLLVPPDDSAALASAISSLLGDPARRRRMGAAARASVVAQFQPADIARAIADVVLDGRSGDVSQRAARTGRTSA